MHIAQQQWSMEIQSAMFVILVLVFYTVHIFYRSQYSINNICHCFMLELREFCKEHIIHILSLNMVLFPSCMTFFV